MSNFLNYYFSAFLCTKHYPPVDQQTEQTGHIYSYWLHAVSHTSKEIFVKASYKQNFKT